MASRNRNAKPSPTLTVVSGGQEDLSNVQPTTEGLQKYVTAVLKEKGRDDVLTHEDVLNNPAFVNLKRTCEAGYKAQIEQVNVGRAIKREALKVTLHQKKLAAAKEVNSQLQVELGLVLTQEQINARLKVPVVDGAKPDTAVKLASNNERLLDLKKRFGSKLLGRVFEDSDAAIVFRIIAITCIRPYHSKISEKGLDPAYLAAITALRAQIQELITMIDKVITVGWGLELQTSVNVQSLRKNLVDTMSADERFAWMMARMGKCPTPEELKVQMEAEAKLAEAKKATDAKKAVAEAAEQQRREKLRQALKARLLETDPDKTENETPEKKTVRENIAEAMATRLAKKYGHLVNVKAVFTAAAIDRKALAERQPDDAAEPTISRYIQAAGLTSEEFNDHRERHALVAECVGDNGSGLPVSGSVSPLGNNTPPNGRKNSQSRKARISAASRALYDSKPKPNEGSGDITNAFKGKKK